MSLARRALPLFGSLAFAACLICGIRVFRASPGSSSPASTAPETRPQDQLAPELVAILAEPDLVRRLDLLAAWVDTRAIEEIVAQVALLRPPERDEVVDLARLKILDRLPDSSTSDSSDEMRRLLAAAETPRPPTLDDQLLAEAAASPALALRHALAPPTPFHLRGRIAQEIVEQTARKDPRAALDLIPLLPGVARDHSRRKVLELWAASTPSAALARALQDDRSDSDYFVGAVMRTWSERDPEAALEAGLALPPGRFGYVTGDLLARWLKADATESVAWLRGQAPLPRDMLAAAFDGLAESEPAFVATLLDGPMQEIDRDTRTVQLTTVWARKDPQAAARWLQTRPRDEAFFQASEVLVAALAERDPDAAFAYFATLPSEADLGDISASLAKNLPDAARAVEWLLTLPDWPEKRHALGYALSCLDDGGSAAILAYAQRIPPGAARAPVYAAAFRAEAEKNPAAAINILRGLIDPAERDATLSSVIDDFINPWTNIARTDAKALAQELPAGAGRDALASRVIESSSGADAASAFTWALALPKSENLGRSIASLAGSQPAAAIGFLKDAPAGPVREAAITGLVYGTVEKEPVRAMELIFAFGSAEMQPRLVKGVAERWANNQPREAAAWAGTLAPGATRDRALAGVAGPLAKKDPPATLALLPLAQDPESRYQIARQALLGQQRTDEAGARRSLATLNLPAADLTRLREDLDSHR